MCTRGLKYVEYGQFHKIPVSMTKLFRHAAAYRRHGKQAASIPTWDDTQQIYLPRKPILHE
jgi:hypothetical protein